MPFVFYVKLYTSCVTAIDFIGIFYYYMRYIIYFKKVNKSRVNEQQDSMRIAGKLSILGKPVVRR